MLTSFWQEFLGLLSDEKKKNPIIFSLFNQLKPVELTEDRLVLSCDNQGFVFYLQKKIPSIERRLSEYAKKPMAIEIIVVEKKKKKKEPLLQFEPSIEDVFHKAGLVGKHAFENFAVSPTNQVAYAAAQAVAGDLGEAYNPLFLYGGVGVGKTHLAQAIARNVLEKDPSLKVLFCPSEQFTNEFIESIREKNTARNRRKYRRLDLLILDDIQFIAGKNAVQEDFFHTFNTIISSRGQVILTSDRPPDEIKKLEDRLRSRFSGGLVVDIQPPDFELRTAILMIKAQEKGIEVEVDVARLIAEQVTDSRALEGTLLSIYAKTLGGQEKIDLAAVELFFSARNGAIREETKKNGVRITPSDVMRVVCSYYNLRQSHLKGSSRAERFSLPRQVVMFLLRNELALKLEEVAFLLKRKDHTTILHGVEKITGLVARNSQFKEEVDRIIKTLRLST